LNDYEGDYVFTPLELKDHLNRMKQDTDPMSDQNIKYLFK